MGSRYSLVLKKKIKEKGNIPTHIAIIMDGNGRWAKKKNMPPVYGHYRGLRTVRLVVQLCLSLSVGTLTLYAFSIENWSRSKEEVRNIFSLIEHFIKQETMLLNKNNVKLRFLGNLETLPQSTYKLIKESEHLLSTNTGLTLNIALSYSARSEIGLACKAVAKKVIKGSLTLEQVTPAVIAQHLETIGLKDPDLLIRTSGEKRLSNFLLWQVAYTELYFTNVYWPNFRDVDFYKAIFEYQGRQRRFGGRHQHCESLSSSF